MIVRELLTRLGWSVDTAGAQKYDNALNKVNRQAMAVTTTLQGMMAAAAAAFSLSSMGRTLDMVTSLEARIAQLPQTIGSSGDAFNYLAEKANAARQPIEAYMTLYSRIGYATKELLPTQEALSGVIDTISQSFVLGGSAASEQAAAMLQLSQAFNKGKLDGDEFRSVMENMPGQVTQSLAEAMGYLNKGELMKASSDGKLVVDELVKGFQRIAPEIEKSFSRMPMTIGQATAIASNKWARFLAKMNRESGAVTWILGKFNALVDGLEKFGDASVKFFGSSTNMVKALAIAIGAILLPALAKLSLSMLAFLASPQGLMLAGLMAIGLALEDIYQWTQGNTSLIGKWLGSFSEFKEKVIAWIGDVKAAFSGAIDHFKKHWANWWTEAKQTMSDIVDQMLDLVPDWIKNLFNKAVHVIVKGGDMSDPNSVPTGPKQMFDKQAALRDNFVNPYSQNSTASSAQAMAMSAQAGVQNTYSNGVSIGDINVTVSNTNASAKDIARETSEAVAARARVGGLASMGMKP